MRLDKERERGPLPAARFRKLLIQQVRGILIQARGRYISKLICESATFGRCK